MHAVVVAILVVLSVAVVANAGEGASVVSKLGEGASVVSKLGEGASVVERLGEGAAKRSAGCPPNTMLKMWSIGQRLLSDLRDCNNVQKGKSDYMQDTDDIIQFLGNSREACGIFDWYRYYVKEILKAIGQLIECRDDVRGKAL